MTTYRMRFEFLVSTYFKVDTRAFDFDLDGRPAVLKSVQECPLKEADAVTIQVGEFRNEQEAWEFGLRLQRAATLAATKTDLGINVGRNRSRTTASEKLRASFLEKHRRVLRNRVHGIDVFAEELPTHILVVQGYGTVTIPPQIFLDELNASFKVWSSPVSSELEKALRLRGQANQARDNLVRMILAIASVEALTPDEFWTDTQKKILQSLTESAKAYPGASEREIEEIIARVNGLPKLSINQAFRRFLDRLGIEDIWPAWRDAYNARSRILHGDAPPEEVIRTIDTTMRLSREIILKAAEHEFSETKVTARESPVSKDS